MYDFVHPILPHLLEAKLAFVRSGPDVLAGRANRGFMDFKLRLIAMQLIRRRDSVAVNKADLRGLACSLLFA